RWRAALAYTVCAEEAYRDRLPGGRAEALLAAALNEGVEVGPALALRAQLALERGRLGKALTDAERAVALSPKEARGHYVRGRVRLERGTEGAVKDLKQAAQLSGRKDGAGLHWLAAALLRAGQTREALTA